VKSLIKTFFLEKKGSSKKTFLRKSFIKNFQGRFLLPRALGEGVLFAF